VIAQPNAPSFLAMNKNTGEVLWTDKSPGSNIMHGQWSSPAFGVLGGVEQVLFAGGDGWLYSFDPKGDGGKSKLLWKFDCNPKESKYMLERATRNPLIATPVIYDGLVYIGVGEDPEHGEGNAHLWCIDPTKRGDVSPTQVFNKANPNVPIPYKRLQACEPDKGDFERSNTNAAVVWHYAGNNPRKFEETMHRTISSAVIKDNLLFITDESGLIHCLDAKTGKPHWTHDMLASSWSTPLIAGDNVYIANLDGGILIFKVSPNKELLSELSMEIPVYTTPVVANGTLYIATFNTLFAIAEGASSKPAAKTAGAGGQ
jgi:outer membrane protein assembly factor BamB